MTDDQSLVAAGKDQEGAALAQRLMAVPATVPAPGLLAAQVPSGVQELPPPAASTNHVFRCADILISFCERRCTPPEAI